MPRTLTLSAYLVLFVASATGAMLLFHSPSPFLLGGLVGGAAFTLLFQAPWTFPDSARHFGIALIGVGAGALIDTDVVHRIRHAPIEIIGGVVVTAVFTMLTGLIPYRSPRVSLPTALLGSLAGAASGVSAIARDLDADEAVVAAIQYARVVVIVVTVAFVSPALGGAEGAPADVTFGGVQTVLWWDVAFTALSAGGGLVLARLVNFSGASLLMPMLLAVAAALAVSQPVTVPAPLLNLGFSVTGLAVGFSFTRATIRLLAHLFPLAALQLLASLGGCALLGIAFARAIGISDLAGYLAMTPGGLPAVAAVAVESGTDVGLVVTMQVMRAFVAILLASVVGTILKRRRAT